MCYIYVLSNLILGRHGKYQEIVEMVRKDCYGMYGVKIYI